MSIVVMTLMVRDEADIIEQMIEHHRAQGIAHFIVTDNGSVDGTTQILQRYADEGVLDLRHDPVHRKQQGTTVTQMARDAHTRYGADWVINADADEFWLPVDSSLTIADALSRTSPDIGSFTVPVIDMTGTPALGGSGLGRLVLRDHRPDADLWRIGLRAHATPNAVHVGSADVEVSQGNHYVSIPSVGTPPHDAALEVLHLPWRSWSQFSDKVEKSGRAYDSNPTLTPSPNHHGMREWARHKAGTLLGYYLLRHPSPREVEEGIAAGWFVEDRRLAALSDSHDVQFVDDEVLRSLRASAAQLAVAESGLAELPHLRGTLANLTVEIADLHAAVADAYRQVEAMRSRKVVRAVDAIAGIRRR